MDRVELNNLYLEVQSKLESLMVEYRILPGELHFYVLNNIEDLCKEFNFGDVKVLKVVLEDVENLDLAAPSLAAAAFSLASSRFFRRSSALAI